MGKEEDEKGRIVPTVWDRFDKLEKQIAVLKEHNHPEIIGKKEIYNLDFINKRLEEVLRDLSLRTYNLHQVILTNVPLDKLTIGESLFKIFKELDSPKKIDPSFETKGYISLKLSRKVDLNKLHSNIHRITQNREIIKRWNEVTWKDVAEGLLKSDGSWEIRPEFYHKYDITKHKEVESEKFEFQLIEKFIPPRNIKCTDCMNNPVPKLIKEFIQKIKLLNNGCDPYPNDPLDILIKEYEGMLEE